jgi:membrane-associated phospholipid phosphatase
MIKSSPFQTVVWTLAISIASTASADVVTDWNTAALNAIRANRTSPPVASRALAILHVAIYDAVNGIARTHEPYAVDSAVPASASKEAAASAAAHVVLVTLFPMSADGFDDLHDAALAAIPDGPQKQRGMAWGEAVARTILALRANDGSDAVVAPPPFSGAGFWQPTPPQSAPYLLPQWGFVTPFVMPAPDAFRPSGPPDIESEKYLADLQEVRGLGAAVGSARTPEQTQIALFWADGAGTETPPGHWNSIARGVAASRGNTLEQNARLFALLNVAMADAAICAWDAKYAFDFWRPVTAIRATVDPAWNSLIVTPPFPDYVSGHSTFSGAASKVLAMFYGTDTLTFSTGSDFLPGVIRTFDAFSAAAAEAAVSRLYGGIHFRSANEDGLKGGIAIGEWTVTHFMQPKGNRSRKENP